jgi:hypothetical protein
MERVIRDWSFPCLEIRIELLKLEEVGETKNVRPLMNFEVYNLNTRMKARTYGTTIDVSIAGLTSAYLNAKVPGSDTRLIFLHTPLPTKDTDQPLLRLHLFSASTPDDLPSLPLDPYSCSIPLSRRRSLRSVRRKWAA